MNWNARSSQDSFAKPNPLIVLLDLISRTVQKQLHLPPRWLRDVGTSDFETTGREFLGYFIDLANLQPDEQVLDIGCGCGRMALPLTGYLSRQGSYQGMDITAAPVGWCQQNITPRYPNFQFWHMDLFNKRYNPNGRYLARDYVFPFDDASFDFIFLTSVFTHLLPDDTENYLGEIARLLRPDGRALVTVFLLNEPQQTLASQGYNDINFKFGSGPYRTRNKDIPESAVAYDETFLYTLLTKCDLVVSDVYYGKWSGRRDGLSYQDILILRPGADYGRTSNL